MDDGVYKKKMRKRKRARHEVPLKASPSHILSHNPILFFLRHQQQPFILKEVQSNQVVVTLCFFL